MAVFEMIMERGGKVNDRRTVLAIALAFGALCLILAIIVVPLTLAPTMISQWFERDQDQLVPVSLDLADEPVPTLTLQPQVLEAQSTPLSGQVGTLTGLEEASFENLYDQVSPGVVSIQVVVEQNGLVGEGAGSGFILDREGHIVTNNHVVDGATLVSVIFFDGFESRAEIVGTDIDSDLAVIKVDDLPDNVFPLVVGDSDNVDVGEWVVAIGNPFGQQSSMTVGVVSAVGRMLPTGTTPFSIPQAIQTDAAINPGNSGGPLLNLQGEVIGVNAQIAASGTGTNSGVGFAIPSNIVRMVAPVLIDRGTYQWPWLGVEGTDVTLRIEMANNLDSQQGAYISGIVEGGPAASAGMRGSSGTKQIEGLAAPVGGDVVVEADGKPIDFFSDLLVAVAFKNPGDTIDMTILRDGVRQQIQVTLAPRR
jgi:S1-C subfamily serine protease